MKYLLSALTVFLTLMFITVNGSAEFIFKKERAIMIVPVMAAADYRIPLFFKLSLRKVGEGISRGFAPASF